MDGRNREERVEEGLMQHHFYGDVLKCLLTLEKEQVTDEFYWSFLQE